MTKSTASSLTKGGVLVEVDRFNANPAAWTDEQGMRFRCGRCHRPMLVLRPAELTSGACECGGLIEADPRNFEDRTINDVLGLPADSEPIAACVDLSELPTWMRFWEGLNLANRHESLQQPPVYRTPNCGGTVYLSVAVVAALCAAQELPGHIALEEADFAVLWSGPVVQRSGRFHSGFQFRKAARATLRAAGIAACLLLLFASLSFAAPVKKAAPKERMKPISTITVKVVPHEHFVAGQKRHPLPGYRITTADADGCTAWVDGGLPDIETAELNALIMCRRAIDLEVDTATDGVRP